MSFLGLFKKKLPKPGIPEVAGMPIPAAHLNALQPSDQFLISYPRSGNTWMRNLLKDVIILSRPDLPQDVHPDHLLPDIHQGGPAHPAQQQFGMQSRILKSHNIRDIHSHRAVYLFRTAADSLLSYYHFGILRRQPWFIEGETADDFCRRFLPTWDVHMRIALEMHIASPARVLFVSYERLLADGLHELRRVVDFYGLIATDETLTAATERNSFEKLRAREQQRVPDAKGFFYRKGREGSAREELSAATVEFLENATHAAHAQARQFATPRS